MLGDDYVAQHIIREWRRERNEDWYKNYIADALYAVTHDLQVSRRWMDVVKDIEKPEDTRTDSDIRVHMLNKLNG